MNNPLVTWLTEYLDEWRDHRDDNYLTDWQEFERLWRGEWAEEDTTRKSERSRITSPALQQAIENHTAEIEEAVFGQGNHLFDIEDNEGDEDPTDVEYIQNYLKESFKKNKARKRIGDTILLAAIYGQGIAEIITTTKKEYTPATQPIDGIDAVAVGVQEEMRVCVYPEPINPQNFLIDPAATSIDEGMGCAVEKFVPAYEIAQKIKDGTYLDADISSTPTPDSDLEASWIDEEFDKNKVHVIRYYGLVPEKLLDQTEEAEFVELFDEEDTSELLQEYGNLVEAIVVIGNGKLLKAERNPFMMQDRPIVAYQDDTVPGRFWGRGVAEKGYNMQKAIDAQLRSHFDSLALTSVPMVAMDATRLPRGSKFEVRPGKSILTNGNPAEILMPFKFGNTDASNLESAGKLEVMLLQATGTIDSAGMQTQAAGAGEMSIVLSSIIKKNKRTLVNFQDNFLIPLIEKIAYRYMQFDPESFPTKDYKFVVNSSLGMLAREVEQLQMINLMKTLGPNSPMTAILMEGVIENSSIPNRAVLLQKLAESQKPNPEAKQMEDLHMQMEMAAAEASIRKTASEVEVNKSQAVRNMAEAQAKPEEIRAKMLAAASTNLPSQDDMIAAEFDRRIKVAELMLKEADLDNNTKIVEAQTGKNIDESVTNMAVTLSDE